MNLSWCRGCGAERGSTGLHLVPVTAEGPWLHAGLGEQDQVIRVCKKDSPEVNRNGGAEWGLASFQGKGIEFYCFIQRALILWWETDKGTVRVPGVQCRSHGCCGAGCQPIHPSCLVPTAHQQSEEALKWELELCVPQTGGSTGSTYGGRLVKVSLFQAGSGTADPLKSHQLPGRHEDNAVYMAVKLP